MNGLEENLNDLRETFHRLAHELAEVESDLDELKQDRVLTLELYEMALETLHRLGHRDEVHKIIEYGRLKGIEND